jgi:hypothetical protein
MNRLPLKYWFGPLPLPSGKKWETLAHELTFCEDNRVSFFHNLPRLWADPELIKILEAN